jgi:FkbM family methyltransferase
VSRLASVLPGAAGREAFRLSLRLGRKTRKAEAARAFAERVARLGQGDVVIDLGANYGSITRQLAASGAVVHAFEPDPDTFARLSAAVAGLPNVRLHAAAASDQDGEAPIFRARGAGRSSEALSEGSTLLSAGRNVSDTAAAMTPTIDIARFVASLGQRVAIVKMDIEGSEIPVLNHLFDTGAATLIDAIFVETHERKFRELTDDYRRLRARVARRSGPPDVNLDWK